MYMIRYFCHKIEIVRFQIGRDGALLILICTSLSSSSLTRCSVTRTAAEL